MSSARSSSTTPRVSSAEKRSESLAQIRKPSPAFMASAAIRTFSHPIVSQSANIKEEEKIKEGGGWGGLLKHSSSQTGFLDRPIVRVLNITFLAFSNPTFKYGSQLPIVSAFGKSRAPWKMMCSTPMCSVRYDDSAPSRRRSMSSVYE